MHVSFSYMHIFICFCIWKVLKLAKFADVCMVRWNREQRRQQTGREEDSMQERAQVEVEAEHVSFQPANIINAPPQPSFFCHGHAEFNSLHLSPGTHSAWRRCRQPRFCSLDVPGLHKSEAQHHYYRGEIVAPGFSWGTAVRQSRYFGMT